MKIFKKIRTKKVGITSILCDIVIIGNIICGVFFQLLYYFIGPLLGIIALLTLMMRQVDFIQKIQQQLSIERIKMNIEEEEYENLLKEAKKEADVAVNVQMKKIYRQQLRKAIYDVFIEKELILNNKLIKKIESEFIIENIVDFKSDEEVHALVEKSVVENFIRRK